MNHGIDTFLRMTNEHNRERMEKEKKDRFIAALKGAVTNDEITDSAFRRLVVNELFKLS